LDEEKKKEGLSPLLILIRYAVGDYGEMLKFTLLVSVAELFVVLAIFIL
jgi:hypothetical protein